jgi:myosin-5
LQLRGYRENQSILVSGESGAGKTVTTKIILDYLATLSQFNNQDHHSNHQSSQKRSSAAPNIETQVLESNPILESFGNARTKRNDNSSRFGKYIELEFSSNGCLVSGSITTYLLEVSRLITRFPDERNYHIFYELLAGLPQQRRRELKIANRGPRDFVLTAHGVMDRRDRIDDRDTFAELCHALDTIGFTKEEQFDLFRVICGLLYTSNLTFSGDEVTSALDTSNPNWNYTTELLGVNMEDLENAFCRCAIEARGEILYKNLSMDRAHKAVEALIKTTYGAMFGYIVQKINSFITVQHKHEQQQQQHHHHSHHHPRHSETSFIGVLDIFGFESFDRNSFEQLCINYCNEALQQQFNRFVFKLEQQEYQKEGIDWSFIEFPDNQDVLDLIEKRHDGILSILDEQSRLQRCTDATFASAIYNKCGSHPRFVATNTMQAQFSFAVSHYAGLVEYDTEFFLEKNKDELPKETTELLQSSSFPFLAKLGRDLTESSQSANSPTQQQPQPQTVSSRSTPFRGKQPVLKRSASSILRDSVGSQFCSQLRVLRTRIESTTPHYVRCLKPNDDLVPHHFDALVIADQLRCAGVLEAIRVSRVGFPHRYNHEHFVYRYGLLERAALAPRRLQKTATEQCAILVDLLAPQVLKVLEENAEEEALTAGRNSRHYLGIQMGKTKVFIRRKAFDCLEYLRSKRIDDAAISIQSIARTLITRKRYVVMVYAAILIQNFFRRVEAYRTAHIIRIENAAKIIFNAMICFPARKRLVAARFIALWCQSAIRGAIARQYCAYIFLDLKASIIQRAWRNFLSCSTRTFRKLKRAVTCIQNRHRVRMARNELRRLRLEQRDLARVAAERDKFKEESIRLRKELEDAKNSPDALKIAQEKAQEVQILRHEVQKLHDELDKAQKNFSPGKEFNETAEKLKEELARKEHELASLRNEVAQLRSKDDNSSLKSLTVDTFLKDLSIYSNHSGHGSPLRKVHASSPVRSDISLLDSEIEEEISSFANGDIEESENEFLRLHSAIRRRNMKQIEKILHQTSEICVLVNQGDQYGRTAMHLASLSLDLEIAEKLINVAGAVVNAQDDDGETPLHLSENAAMTELLLKKGKANPNIPNVDGICALHLAVQRRDIDSVRALIMNNANVNNADNIRWFTALHLIALPARKEIDEKPGDDVRCRIAHLLTGNFGQNAPDLDYQDSDGNSPLHYAVQLETEDACDLVNIFLEKGANPNLRNMRDQAPLHLLCHNDKLRNRKNFQEVVYTLLVHGADPNLQSLTGCTPLHLSLYHRDVNCAIQLVRGGAELHLVWKKVSFPAWCCNVKPPLACI